MNTGTMFNFSGPPRSVPIAVRARVLFGGILSQFGWLFLGFGLIFGWVFGLQTDVTGMFLFRGELSVGQGTITASEETPYYEGGDEHTKGTAVYASRYTWLGPDERWREGVSYAVGRRLEPDAPVTIEYATGKPEVSRIRGMRRSPFAVWAAFVFIFPLIGLCIVAVGLRRGLKANRLLGHGCLALGRLQSKAATNTKVNDRPVYNLTFAFEDQDGSTCEAHARSHTPEELEDDAEEPLLYDPANPAYSVMLDNLPGAPRIDESGGIQSGNSAAAAASLLLPAATLIGHGSYLYLRFVQ